MVTTFKNRGEQVFPTEGVRLRAQFSGPDGLPADLDSFPTVTITQPSGNVMLGPTSAGVYKVSTGLYGYDFITGINQNIGVYMDTWRGTISGYPVMGSFNFIVIQSQIPAINTDGYMHLGDDVPFNFSQNAIFNINKLLKIFRARVNSAGKKKSKDKYGNDIYVDCDIYSIDQMVSFLGGSLAMFNAVPTFSNYTFDDSDVSTIFADLIVQGAVISALASKALIEKGKEFNVTDNGLSFTPATVADMLNSQYGTELANHMEKIKLTKQNLRPKSLGLGTLSVNSYGNPAVNALRFRKARRIF